MDILVHEGQYIVEKVTPYASFSKNEKASADVLYVLAWVRQEQYDQWMRDDAEVRRKYCDSA